MPRRQDGQFLLGKPRTRDIGGFARSGGHNGAILEFYPDSLRRKQEQTVKTILMKRSHLISEYVETMGTVAAPSGWSPPNRILQPK